MRYFWVVFVWLALFPFFPVYAEPLGTPDREDIEYPDDDPPPKELVQLGKTLFFDPRLSFNNSQSCATCHNPDLGMGDGMALGLGAKGTKLPRNVSHIYNLAWNANFSWNGRAESLEEQLLEAISSEDEMNMPMAKLIPKLKKVLYYRSVFKKLFEDGEINSGNLASAIAAFKRTIISDNSAFDQYLKGDQLAMSPAAIRGMKLFEGKARCALCHGGPNFTSGGFHNIGIDNKDVGRYEIQKDAASKGAFKTPGLRNILLSAPYMHDGSLVSLEETIRYYNKGGNKVEGLDSQIKPLNLTELEIFDLIAFLGALTDPVFIERPKIP